jgi:hypothetical protein
VINIINYLNKQKKAENVSWLVTRNVRSSNSNCSSPTAKQELNMSGQFSNRQFNTGQSGGGNKHQPTLPAPPPANNNNPANKPGLPTLPAQPSNKFNNSNNSHSNGNGVSSDSPQLSPEVSSRAIELLTALFQENENLKLQLSEAQAQGANNNNSNLEQELQRAEKQHKQQIANIEQSNKSQVSSLESQLKSIENKLREAQNTGQKLEGETKTLKSQLQKTNDELDKEKQNSQSLQTQLTNANNSIANNSNNGNSGNNNSAAGVSAAKSLFYKMEQASGPNKFGSNFNSSANQTSGSNSATPQRFANVATSNNNSSNNSNNQGFQSNNSQNFNGNHSNQSNQSSTSPDNSSEVTSPRAAQLAKIGGASVIPTGALANSRIFRKKSFAASADDLAQIQNIVDESNLQGNNGSSSGQSTSRAQSRRNSRSSNKPPAPPVNQGTAIAAYGYDAQRAEEISFQPGDIITVIDKDPSGWWTGSIRGSTGLFPSNYTQPN